MLSLAAAGRLLAVAAAACAWLEDRGGARSSTSLLTTTLSLLAQAHRPDTDQTKKHKHILKPSAPSEQLVLLSVTPRFIPCSSQPQSMAPCHKTLLFLHVMKTF